MSKETRDLAILENRLEADELFTANEKLVIIAIYLGKVRSGIQARLVQCVSTTEENLRAPVQDPEIGNALELLGLHDDVEKKSYENLRDMAGALGISFERFQELVNFVYDNETRI